MSAINKPISTENIEKRYNVIRTVVAILISLAICFALIYFSSSTPLKALKVFLTGPLTSINRMGFVVEKMIPLLFTGTAICIMYSCGQINVGVESAFYFSGVMAAWVSLIDGMPKGIHPVLCILAGGISGAFICGLTAVWHVKFNAMTLVTSLMFNWVFLNLGQYIINYVIWDPAVGYQASYLYNETALLSQLFSKTNIHTGLIVGIIVVVFGYIFLYKTTYGYGIRTIGKNINFARYSGLPVNSYIIGCQVLGGFLAGLGGSIEQLGMYKRFTYGGLSGHGFDGVMIAVIAGLNPKLVPVGALFLAYLRTGAEVMSRQVDVPTEIVSIVQAVVIIFIASERFLAKFKHKAIVKASKHNLEFMNGEA